MSKQHLTIHDIAKLCGVGVGTVSRVLNGHSKVSAKTRQRVLEAIEAQDYVPQSAARAIRTKRSLMIGLMAESVTTTPFAFDLVKGALNRAREAGYLVMLLETDGDMAEGERAVQSFLRHRVEGVVYAAAFHHGVKMPTGLRKFATVTANSFDLQGELPCVVPDEIQGGYAATRHLIEQGHQRIAIITNDRIERGYPAAAGRLEGYRRALAEAGLAWDAALIREGDVGNASDGYAYAKEVLDIRPRPSAIFFGTDRMAMGGYDAIKARGLRIPEDISVVGFDNQLYVADALYPALTTVALPHAAMGIRAIEWLLTKPTPAPVREALACPLVARASVAPPPAA